MGQFIFWTIFAIVIAAILAPQLRLARWRRNAHRMAQRQNIALPVDLERRIARVLRRRHIAALAVVAALIPVEDSVLGQITFVHNPRTHAITYLVVLLVVPVIALVVGLGVTPVRLKSPEGRRVSHLIRPTRQQIFTRQEWLAIVAGLAASATSSMWLLWRVGDMRWWPAFGSLVVAVYYGWTRAVQAVLTRASYAADELELGWDDLLRYGDARGLTAAVAWAPAAVATMLVIGIAVPDHLFLATFGVLVGVGALLARVFKQGRTLWRQSWQPSTAN